MRNVIAFQKNILVTPNIGIDNRNLAMMVQSELMQFGYMLSQDALNQLGHSDAADIQDFHNEVINYLKEMTGGQRDYRPVYSGFPQQVMAMSEFELWWNQLVGYYRGGTFTANEWTEAKGTAFEHVKYKMIEAGTEDDFKNIFTVLAKSGTSLTPADLGVIKWFVNDYPNLEFPEIIPFKENLCTILGLLSSIGRGFDRVKLPKLTTTDVLRVVVYLSGGDISLPALPPQKIKTMSRNGRRFSASWDANPERAKFKFKKFKRSERKFILELLENSNLDTRDMKLKDGRWIRLGEILHPGEYQTEFPRTYKAFQKIRNEKVTSWYGEVDKAFKMSFDVGLAKLSERPGEFLRRLDVLVRKSTTKNIQSILGVLSKIGAKSSNKVLFEVYDHFEERRNPVTGRSIFIKGARQKTPLPNLPAIPNTIVEMIQSTIFDIIKTKFAELPALGDCWIDEELKKIPLPTNMRSLNDSLVPTVRGQRVPFGGEKKVIRPFIHWFDEYGELDIDLHGFLFGDHNNAINFGYNGIHNSTLGCYSGDVRQRQGACAEYVDINVDAALRNGYQYFLMVAHNFQRGTLAEIKECVAGVMERDHPESNRTWLPSTIQNSMLLKGGGNMVLVAVYDLKTREYIHLDLDADKVDGFVYGSLAKNFMEIIAPFILPPKVSVYDLLLWHVEARGRIVSKETATTHFLYEDFGSSYVKTIEYMGV